MSLNIINILSSSQNKLKINKIEYNVLCSNLITIFIRYSLDFINNNYSLILKLSKAIYLNWNDESIVYNILTSLAILSRCNSKNIEILICEDPNNSFLNIISKQIQHDDLTDDLLITEIISIGVNNSVKVFNKIFGNNKIISYLRDFWHKINNEDIDMHEKKNNIN